MTGNAPRLNSGEPSPPNDFWALASSHLQYAVMPCWFGQKETRDVMASDNGCVILYGLNTGSVIVATRDFKTSK